LSGLVMVLRKFVTFFVTRTGSEIAPEALMQQLVGASTESASVYWCLLVICSLRPPRFGGSAVRSDVEWGSATRYDPIESRNHPFGID